MALVGEAGLVGHIGNLVPGAQPCFGVLHARVVKKAAGRQAGILLERPD